MDAGSTFVADVQPAKSVEPRHRAFDDPSCAPHATAVVGAPFGQVAVNAAPLEFVAMRLRVVRPVALDQLRFSNRPAGTAAQRRHRIDQREQLGDVVPIGGGQCRDERNPLGVGENVMFRPGLAAIGRVRSSFFPPRNARSEALSTTARSKSKSPRRRNSVSKTVCNRFQTPARCHRTSRRQQVVPDPQPISCGSMFQGMPLRSTNRMPVNTARSGMGLRPAYRRRRDRRFGSRGSIRFHNSSSSKDLVMHGRLPVGHAKVPSSRSKYKRVVS
jgi:hypothetical protein